MFSVFMLVLVASVSDVFPKPHTVIVLSFDGFSPDYVEQGSTPTLFDLKRKSATPLYMDSVFPSKTFVTHFTASTGLYPEDHGVLGNHMFDKDGRVMFNVPEQFQTDESIVPIWIENQKLEGRHSGVMMWPGSEFSYQNITPSHIIKYERKMDWGDRIKTIMSWIQDKIKPANLVMTYFEDDISYGKKDLKLESRKKHISQVDDTVKKMIDEIKSAGLENEVNLIILSDHGTHQVTSDNILFINKYMYDSYMSTSISGPNIFIVPRKGLADGIYDAFKNHADNSHKYNIYKKEEIPQHWHMKKSSNLDGILYLVAEPDYTFYYEHVFREISSGIAKDDFVVDENGYDLEDKAMRAFFISIGPSFKKELVTEPFEIIDVYPLLKHLLDLKQQASHTQAYINMKSSVEKLLS